MNSYIDEEKLNIVRNRKGFIAALDQSGGSSGKTLEKYGIPKDSYSTDEEMFDLIHEMRKRVITSPAFTKDRILGTILFYKTMNSEIEGKYTADYLWKEKEIVSFLKVDKGLEEEKDGVKLMKEIPDLTSQIEEAKEKHVFGTKMRSVIYEPNEKGIEDIVRQQFEFAKIIADGGLVPIIEPEVDINANEKEKCEEILKSKIKEELDKWNKDEPLMFKFTIPTKDNLYLDLYEYEAVLKIVALSGGYDNETACKYLEKNNNMIASFSRALLEDLRVDQTDEEFNDTLAKAIEKIYVASIS